MSFTQPHGSSAPAGDDTRYSRMVGVLGGTLAASWLHLQLPASAAISTKNVSPRRKRSARAMGAPLSLLGRPSRVLREPAQSLERGAPAKPRPEDRSLPRKATVSVLLGAGGHCFFP